MKIGAAQARLPSVVGVGQVSDRSDDHGADIDSLDLMERALRLADADAGGGWLDTLGSIDVVAQISCPELDREADRLAARVGASGARCAVTASPSGNNPLLLLNEAASRIARGEIESAAVVGGEALRSAARRRKAGRGITTNAVQERSSSRTPERQQRYGLTSPVDIYPLYENAFRAAEAQTLAEAQQESASIWSLMSHVAAANPHAWIRRPHTTEEILNVSDANRLIAFPYSKLMVANSAVNQGAAFIITSETEARRRRISEDRLVYVGLGAAAHEPADVLARENFHRSVSLQLTLSRTLELNRLAAEDLDLAELYSCFPCIPKMAMRAIGWPVDRPATVAGGLTFAGGPIGNYMSHAIAAMTERLRHSGRHGLLFGNGGFATYNHAIVLSRDQRVAARHPAAFSVQAESDSLRGRPPGFLDGYVGHGTIETYTVLYDRNGRPARGAIVALTPNRERFLASVPASDERTIEFLTDASCEPVGKPGTASAGPDGLTVWTPSN